MASLRVVPSRSILRGATKLQPSCSGPLPRAHSPSSEMLARNVHHPVSFLASRGYEGCFTCHTRDKMAAHHFVVTTFLFIFISHWFAKATGEITAWICNDQPKTLPAPRRRTITPHLLCLVKLRHPPMVVRMYPSCQYTQIRRIRPVHHSRRGDRSAR